MAQVETGIPMEFYRMLERLMPGETGVIVTQSGRRFVFCEEEEFLVLCQKAGIPVEVNHGDG